MAADAPGAPHPPGRDVTRRAAQWWWLWAVLALATGAITVAAAGDFNIVDLELAGSLERADEIVTVGDLGPIRSAIYWDFAFLVFYGLALCTGSLWAGRQFRRGLGARLAPTIATVAALAATLDIVENLSMLGYLNSWGGWSGWTPLARTVAIAKFMLVFISIAYVLVGIGTWARRSLANRRRPAQAAPEDQATDGGGR